MPQFDTSFYLTQAIWMLGSFAFLYVMMAFLICPMIEDVLEERQLKIKQDLDKAEHLNKQAEVLHQRYQTFVVSAEKEKSRRIQDSYEQIQKTAAEMEKKNDMQLRRKVRQAERKIDMAVSDIQQKSEKLSAQVAEMLAKRLSEGGEGI